MSPFDILPEELLEFVLANVIKSPHLGNNLRLVSRKFHSTSVPSIFVPKPN